MVHSNFSESLRYVYRIICKYVVHAYIRTHTYTVCVVHIMEFFSHCLPYIQHPPCVDSVRLQHTCIPIRVIRVLRAPCIIRHHTKQETLSLYILTSTFPGKYSVTNKYTSKQKYNWFKIYLVRAQRNKPNLYPIGITHVPVLSEMFYVTHTPFRELYKLLP